VSYPGPSCRPYSSECVEGQFSEVRLEGVLQGASFLLALCWDTMPPCGRSRQGTSTASIRPPSSSAGRPSASARCSTPANWRGSRRATILAHRGRSTAPPSRLTGTGAEATATRMASRVLRGPPPYPYSYIHPSAWKGDFPELRLEGVLGSSPSTTRCPGEGRSANPPLGGTPRSWKTRALRRRGDRSRRTSRDARCPKPPPGNPLPSPTA